MQLLREIASDIGLTVDALYKLRERHEDFPKPIQMIGRYSLYEPREFKMWYRMVIQPHGNSKKNREGQ